MGTGRHRASCGGEANEANNVIGPRAISVTAPAGADLVVASIGNPPASAAPGKAFAVTDTVKNPDATAGTQSATPYYLLLDATKDASDGLLTGTRTVPALAPGVQSAGTATVTIWLSATPPGTHQLLACADDLQVVAETSEVNNCRAAAGTVLVGLPDLVETAVTNPPAAARPVSRLAVTDTRNGSPRAGIWSGRGVQQQDRGLLRHRAPLGNSEGGSAPLPMPPPETADCAGEAGARTAVIPWPVGKTRLER